MWVNAVAVPIDEENVDTGKIFPSRFLRKPRSSGFRNFLFHDLRFDETGRQRSDFIMNHRAYRDARILVAGANFGCGSSRESAVHAFVDAGFRCLVAPSFGEIFAASCYRNGLLPVVLPGDHVRSLCRQLHEGPGAKLGVDLHQQFVAAPDGQRYSFEIDEARKARMEQGLDDCALARQAIHKIEQFERRYMDALPWLRSTNVNPE